jgi:hypothetical protein
MQALELLLALSYKGGKKLGDILYEAGIYIFVLGLVVQSLYRIFDPIIHSISKLFKKEKTKEQKAQDTIDEETCDDPEFIGNRIKPYGNTCKPDWKDLLGPPIVGLIVAWLFWPRTVFDYLPFQPQFPIVAYIITALLISRISNAEHDSFKVIGEFFLGIIHRVYPPMH